MPLYWRNSHLLTDIIPHNTRATVHSVCDGDGNGDGNFDGEDEDEARDDGVMGDGDVDGSEKINDDVDDRKLSNISLRIISTSLGSRFCPLSSSGI